MRAPALNPRSRVIAAASLLLALLATCPDVVGAQGAPAATVARAPTLALATANDNRTPAGTRRGRVVSVTLELQVVRWRPAGDSLLEYVVRAFVEPGRAPQVPGPLLRARVGDELRLTLRNPTERDLRVVGLADRADPAAARDSLLVRAGETRELTIRLRTPGAWWYDAVTRRDDEPPLPPAPLPEKRPRHDAPLLGALVVDDAHAPADVAARDRIFLVHSGADLLVIERELQRRARVPVNRLNINGASWPATERLDYAVGDSVRWRLINTTFLPHPLHLHGFYFRVDGRGDFTGDTTYGPAARRMAVTELVESFTTATITWVPERPGNWLFHCHLLNHMSPMRGLVAGDAAAHVATHGATRGATHDHDPRDHMAGMVLGIHVRGREARRPEAAIAPRRRLDLFAQSRDSALALGLRGYGFVLGDAAAPPPRDSVRRPGAPIVVTRGEPVAVTVHNRLAKPLAVHWHGMELESRYDGVGGWSGTPGSVTPAIPAGDTFVARFTPRRAGTFIYHTHDESDNELNAGLYGPLLVLEPGARRDTTRDHLLVFASGDEVPPAGLRVAARPRPIPVVNGDTTPRPLVLAPGANRVRLIQISDSDIKHLRLVDSTGTVLQWRVLAKDGWTRPRAQQAPRVAEMSVGVGETYDLEVDAAMVAARGPVWLEVVTRYYPGYRFTFMHAARVPVVVDTRTAARR